MYTKKDTLDFIQLIKTQPMKELEIKFGQRIIAIIPAPYLVGDEEVREYADKFRQTDLSIEEFVSQSGYKNFDILVIGDNPPNQQWYYRLSQA